jgi:hypothetical protein
MELMEGFRAGGNLEIGAADTARRRADTRKEGFVRSHPVATISCGKGSSLIGGAATAVCRAFEESEAEMVEEAREA